MREGFGAGMNYFSEGVKTAAVIPAKRRSRAEPDPLRSTAGRRKSAEIHGVRQGEDRAALDDEATNGSRIASSPLCSDRLPG